MERAEREVRALAKRLPGIRDPGMAATYVRRRLEALEPAEVAEMLMLTMSAAEVRDPDHLDLLQALCLALSGADSDTLREAIAGELRAREQHLLALAMGAAPEADTSADPVAQKVPDFGKGRPLSLGERKALARRNDRDLIDRVLRDPHPDVIRILLGNPGLTEAKVIRLCARRPINGSVLREVFRSARWIVRYDIKRALMLNPYAPVDIGLQLAPMLTQPDLRRVLETPGLPAPLRELCERVVQAETLH